MACDVPRRECYPLDGSCSDEAPCPPGLSCEVMPTALCMGCAVNEDCRPEQNCLLGMCITGFLPLP